jgi:hypothetical protein
MKGTKDHLAQCVCVGGRRLLWEHNTIMPAGWIAMQCLESGEHKLTCRLLEHGGRVSSPEPKAQAE